MTGWWLFYPGIVLPPCIEMTAICHAGSLWLTHAAFKWRICEVSKSKQTDGGKRPEQPAASGVHFSLAPVLTAQLDL